MSKRLIEISCDEARRELVGYFEGDLQAEARAAIEHHLKHCDHCTAVYDGVRNVMELFGSYGAIELPEGYSKRLYQKFIAETRKSTS